MARRSFLFCYLLFIRWFIFRSIGKAAGVNRQFNIALLNCDWRFAFLATDLTD